MSAVVVLLLQLPLGVPTAIQPDIAERAAGHDTLTETVADDGYEVIKELMLARGVEGFDSLKVASVGKPAHRGLVLTKDLVEHEKVVNVPFEAMLQASGPDMKAAVGDVVYCNALNHTEVKNPFVYHSGPRDGEPYLHRMLSMYLVHEWRRGKDSPWYDYLKTLPKKFSMLEDFEGDALDQLEGTSLHNTVTRTMAFHQAEHELLQMYLPVCRKNFNLTWEEWHWARRIVTTRAFNYDMTSTTGKDVVQDLCLIPYIELANHAPCNVSWYTLNKTLYVYTIDKMYAGDEFYISYGDQLDNNHLIEYYGFVLDDNNNPVPSDCASGDCECVMGHLGAFKTSIKKDTELLESRDLAFDVRNAIHLRQEQHKVLLHQAVVDHCE